MDSMGSKNYYELFNVSPDANYVDIKVAFHKLARIYHPDRNITDKLVAPLDSTRFMEIQEAWKILSDPITRRNYDKNMLLILKSYKSALSCAEEVTIDDFSLNDEGTYSMECRCGDCFQVNICHHHFICLLTCS